MVQGMNSLIAGNVFTLDTHTEIADYGVVLNVNSR